MDVRRKNTAYPSTTISPRDASSSRMISPTAGATIRPDNGFLMLITGAVSVASTSDFSKDKSVSIISQSISFRFLQ